MLEVLRITNYAIIEQLDLELQKGLTTITGETGAGKSIMLGALRLILGDRATAEAVRTGAQRASVEALFRNDSSSLQAWLTESGFCDDEEDHSHIIIRRDILAAGSSRNFVNNRSATLAQLRALGERLVDLHGQNDHTALLSPANQLRLLDSFGGYETELKSYQAAYVAYRQAVSRFAELTDHASDAERRKSFLEFQVEEISKAQLVPGEEDLLDNERRRLMNAERLGTACANVCDILYEGERTENPASAQVAAAVKALGELAAMDPSQEPLAKEAEAIRFAIEELCDKVRDYAGTVSANPERLAAVEERLQIIRGLKRKYGASIEEVIATGESLSAELQSIINRDAEIAVARESVAGTETKAVATGEALSKRRIAAAQEFNKRVQAEMRELELPKAVLQVQVKGAEAGAAAIDTLTASGADSVEFLASLNAGEELRAMRKVASGGEISRIMLAIKSVVAGRDEIPTLIFDEIDVGISGQAAAKVGEKLSRLADTHQVLCITHLPQIAARGDQHLVVEKTTVQGRTRATVETVSGEERTTALARMLSGAEFDDTSRKYAEKLLTRSK